MPRKPGPWQRASRGKQWMATIHGKQVPLDIPPTATKDEATKVLDALLAALAAQNPARNVPTTQLGDAVRTYLAGRAGRVKPHTLTGYTWMLGELVKHFGPATLLYSLSAATVEESAARPGWSQSTRHDYLGCVATFLKHAGHPLKLHRPPKESRGADAVWTEQEFWQVYGAARGDFKPYLLVLRDTGARPSEVAGLTVEGVDWEHGLARLAHHKTARKGKTRVVHFPESVMVVLRGQRDRHREGALFRGSEGEPLTQPAVMWRMIRARDRAGVTRPISCYGLRHGFICRALESNLTSDQVAALVGNSPEMISKHYSHIGANAAYMGSLAERVAGKAG